MLFGCLLILRLEALLVEDDIVEFEGNITREASLINSEPVDS